MMNIRADKEFVEMFDRVAKIHNRDRTKELKELMLQDIRAEFPEYQPPENY
jgi:hypothetical protein